MRIRRSLRLRKFYHSMRQLQGGTFYSTLICIRSKCFFCCHTLPQTRIWRDHCGLRGHRFCRLNEQLQMLTGSLSFLQYFSIRPDLDHIAQRCPEKIFRRILRRRINIHLKEYFLLSATSGNTDYIRTNGYGSYGTPFSVHACNPTPTFSLRVKNFNSV